MSYADGYAGMLSMQSYYCDSEDDEAVRLLERQRVVFYCAGDGAPVVECRNIEEWRVATRRKPSLARAHGIKQETVRCEREALA